MLLALSIASLFVGKYPLSVDKLLAGDGLQWRVFLTLRLSRTVVGVIGGFSLGIAGFIYQTVFRNPLASPDIIGVSSGASAGAAAGILFLSGSLAVTVSSFAGALLAVVLALGLSSLDRNGKNSTIVLAGIAVHSLAQTCLMFLKLSADPERELAAIEYWIMGSLSGISIYSIGGNLLLCVISAAALFALHRQVILLSAQEGEARMLGVNVPLLRLVILLVATLAVASVVVNRMKHPNYPDTLRGVIYQAGQFTPAHNGSIDRVLERGVKDACVQVANDALAGKNNVGDCLNFRSASSGHVGTVIGGNVFF